jgi:predicted small lipoprotein YifL
MKKSLTLILAAGIALTACQNKKPLLLAAAEVQADAQPGQCPYLTKDSKGHALLSWVRMTGDSSALFCYAVASDGTHFGKPIVIPNSNNILPHGENLPKIIAKPSGELIALWGAPSANLTNKYAGMVFYAQSFDDGRSWSDPRLLTGDTASYDQRYYDVALMPDGEAAIIWLDNRKTPGKEGSALYFARTNGRNGFEQEHRIAESCCPCCRTDLFIDAKGGIHALYRSILQGSVRDMVHTVSTDNGKTFSSPVRISNDNWVINGCPHTGPAMTENKEGLHFAWFTGGKHKGCFYTQSKDDGGSFTPADSVSTLGSHPQLAALADGELLTVWDETLVVDKQVHKRIGIQRRTAQGLSEGKQYITPDDANASYPVLLPISGDSSLVAYSEKKGNHTYILYCIVSK